MSTSHFNPASPPRVAVIGVGAMGSIYAGFFAEAGYEVSVVDVWAAHVAAIATKGLRLEGGSGDRVIAGITACDRIADLGDVDLYVIATKANGVAAVAAELANVMKPGSLVLTIQNGLGADERIGRHMPVDNVLLGVAEGVWRLDQGGRPHSP